jgi:3-dehydroquinate synthase
MGTVTTRLSLPVRASYSCEILIRKGSLGNVRSFVERIFENKPSSIVIITDSNVGKLYGDQVKRDLSNIAPTHVISIKAGERSKTIEEASNLLSKLASLNLDRNGIIIALGGGVVGDLAGFVASIYKRGVAYFQVPTTLLAQVDSSIGGKTGVDTEWGKNQIGTFYHPIGVLIDPSILKSLPESELINGVGEVVKYSVIASRKLFEHLSGSKLNLQELTDLIPQCCAIKVNIVSRDPTEDNMRSILNYGHTIGHVLEASSRYSLSHGKSVILGMLAEGWISRELDFFKEDDYERQQELLQGLGVSTEHLKLKGKELVSLALADKKSSSGLIKMSLPEKIGKMHKTKTGSYRIPVSTQLFEHSLKYLNNLS